MNLSKEDIHSIVVELGKKIHGILKTAADNKKEKEEGYILSEKHRKLAEEVGLIRQDISYLSTAEKHGNNRLIRNDEKILLEGMVFKETTLAISNSLKSIFENHYFDEISKRAVHTFSTEGLPRVKFDANTTKLLI